MCKSQLKSTIYFAILLVATLIGTETFLMLGLRRSGDEFNRKINAVVGNKISSDLTVWGSSTTLVHFDAKAIQEELGIPTFNMGLDGTNFNQYFGLLLKFVENNPSTKYIVINVNVHGFAKRELFNHNHFWIPYLKNELIYEAALYVNSNTWKVKNIPFYDLTVIDKHAIRPIVKTYFSGNFSRNNLPIPSNKGFEPRDIDGYHGSENSFNLDIQETNVRKLMEVLRSIKEKGVKIILTATPSYIGHQNLAGNLDDFKKVMLSVHEELEIPYINFLEDDMCLDKSLFYESIHLNRAGAEILTNKFIDKMKEIL